MTLQIIDLDVPSEEESEPGLENEFCAPDSGKENNVIDIFIKLFIEKSKKRVYYTGLSS